MGILRARIGRRTTGWALAACGCVALAVVPRAARAADPVPTVVHEWSLWIVDATQSQTNAKDQYPNRLPVFIGSQRSRLSGRAEHRPAPLGMITFHGEPTASLELELQIAAGSRFLAHWPPAETKSKRARWADLALSTAADETARLALADEPAWLAAVRNLEGVLFLKQGARAERFVCYDVETTWAPAVKLSGGPERYQVTNLDKSVVEDVFVIARDDAGRRVGRIRHLPGKIEPTPPPKPADPVATAPAAAAKPGGLAALVAGRVKQALAPAAGLAAPAAQAAPAGATPATAAPAAATPPAAADAEKARAAEAAATLELVMSEPLAADSPALAEQTTAAVQAMLVDAGLTRGEAELFLSIYADDLFQSPDLVVLLRLPSAALDEPFPLTTYPDVKRIVRVPLVLLRNADPKLHAGFEQLVAQLGDDDYQKREQAETGLRESGRLALPLIKAALKNPDPEVVLRAERLLLRLNEAIADSSAVLPVPPKKDEKKDAKKEGQGEPKKQAPLKGLFRSTTAVEQADVVELTDVQVSP